MQNNIIKELNDIAPYISEDDLDLYLPKLLDFYSAKIAFLSRKSYGNNIVGYNAFKEMAKTEIRKALNTFIFTSELWKQKRDINPYILTCLNRLSDKISDDVNVIKKTNYPICPIAKLENIKEFLIEDGKYLKSNYCISKIQELQKENNLSNQNLIKFYTLFALHSKKGYKCPECNRFVPANAAVNKQIICPYTDCAFVGFISTLKPMAHPVSSKIKPTNSLQELIFNDGSSGLTKQDLLEDDNRPDTEIFVSESFETELNTLKEVIKEQLSLIRRTNSSSTLHQKLLMYEAFDSMTDQMPYEMVSYLVHRKQNADFPIQSRIFQEYIKLIQNVLPIEIIKNGKKHTIVSLTDPLMSLFTGFSEYEAIVDENECIPNNTKELYVGERQFKCYGPCFIGKLIDVVDQNSGESLLSNVIEYSFVKIKIANVEPGTQVLVKHFRIPSHYEMGSLVYLQRARKKIVDRVYFKLNGKKRKSGE